jgi:hypothetical protein
MSLCILTSMDEINNNNNNNNCAQENCQLLLLWWIRGDLHLYTEFWSSYCGFWLVPPCSAIGVRCKKEHSAWVPLPEVGGRRFLRDAGRLSRARPHGYDPGEPSVSVHLPGISVSYSSVRKQQYLGARSVNLNSSCIYVISFVASLVRCNNRCTVQCHRANASLIEDD